MTIRLHCTCGSSAVGLVTPDARARRFMENWNREHFGPGHAPCDAKAASRARAKEDRREAVRNK